MRPVFECHTELVECVRRVTHTWAISFCSKYLSFHFPGDVPVYDRKSGGAAIDLVPRADLRGFDAEILDYDYGRHYLRILRLLEELKRVAVNRPDLRVVDYVLCSVLGDA